MEYGIYPNKSAGESVAPGKQRQAKRFKSRGGRPGLAPRSEGRVRALRVSDLMGKKAQTNDIIANLWVDGWNGLAVSLPLYGTPPPRV